MLAQGADIVGGQLVPLVDIAADLAHPALLLAGGRRGGGGLGLDVGLIVAVGGAGGAGEDAAVQHVGQEEGVGAQVGGGHHLAAQPGVGALGDVGDAVGVLAGVGEAGELIHVTARLEAKTLEKFEIRLFRQDRHGKPARFLYHIVGVIALVHGDDDAVGVGGHLDGGVGDTAVVLVTFFAVRINKP